MALTTAVDEVVLKKARCEYLEMPGLRLTCEQAQRLFGLDRCTCDQVLCTLTAVHFLARTGDGTFVMAPRPK